MRRRAVPSQVVPGAETRGKPVRVERDACGHKGYDTTPRGARKECALQREGGHTVREGIHVKSVRGFGRLFGSGYEQPQSARHDAKFDRQASQWLAVHLGVGGRIGLDRFTNQTIRLPEIDAFFLAQIAEPKSRKVTEIAQAALRR